MLEQFKQNWAVIQAALAKEYAGNPGKLATAELLCLRYTAIRVLRATIFAPEKISRRRKKFTR